MPSRRILLAAGAAVLAVLGLVFYLSVLRPLGERRQQLNRLLEALDLLVAATVSEKDFSRRWPEAMAAWQRLEGMDAEFRNSAIAREISATMSSLADWRPYHRLEKVKDKELLLKLSEVKVQPPSVSDRTAYREAVEFGIIKRGSPIEVGLYLSPWAAGSEVTRACLDRAHGHLQNAKILAGKASGKLFTPPALRTPQEWLAVLPPEHPEKTGPN